MKRIGSAFVVAVLVAATAGAQPRRFVAAIVRLDGRLVPFAAYDGTRWAKAWPEPVEWMPGNPTLDAVPSVWRRRGERVPDRWHVWRAASVRPVQARVSGAEIVDAHCQAQVALKTDLPPEKGEHPFKLGVAVDNASVSMSPIEELHVSDVLWMDAEEAVVAAFTALEAAQAQADRAPLPREMPAPVVRVEAVYGQAGIPGSPLYFVAEKLYRTAPDPQDPECTARTILTGWLVPATDGAFNLREPRVFLTDCDAKATRTALPLAALRVSGRLFWVLQEQGYEDETYVIAEIGPSEVRYPLTVNGGGC